MRKRKENRGGARERAGRHRKYLNPEKINFRIESEDKTKLKRIYLDNLNEKFNEWVKQEINKNKHILEN